MKKRLLSWIMVVCMLMTLVPSNVLAAVENQDTENMLGAQQEGQTTPATTVTATPTVTAVPTEPATPTETAAPTETAVPTEPATPTATPVPKETVIPEVTLSEAATAVRAQIAALPTTDQWNAMTLEEQNNAGLAAYAASDAYDALSEEDKAALAEDYQVLMNLFQVMNGMVSGYVLENGHDQKEATDTISVTVKNETKDDVTKFYSDFYWAIEDMNNAGGGTIKLLANDPDIYTYPTVTATATLDLQGHRLDLGTYYLGIQAEFTVMDSKYTENAGEDTMGVIKGANEYLGVLQVESGRLIMDGGKIENYGVGPAINMYPATAPDMNSNDDSKYSVVIKNDSIISSSNRTIVGGEASVKIDGGTISGEGNSRDPATVYAQYIKVNGGTIEGKTGCLRNSGNSMNESWISVTGGNIVTEGNESLLFAMKNLEISGGNFNSTQDAIKIEVGSATVSGGSFGKKISMNRNLKDALASGYSFYTKNGNIYESVNLSDDQRETTGPVVVAPTPAYTPSTPGTDGWYSATNLPVLTAGTGWDGIATTADGPFNPTVTVEEEALEEKSASVYLYKNMGTTETTDDMVVKAADFSYKLDKTVPVWSDVDLGNNFTTEAGWIYSKEALKVKMTIGDGQSGVDSVKYTLKPESGDPTPKDAEYVAAEGTYQFTIPVGYNGYVYVTVTDKAGNAVEYTLCGYGICDEVISGDHAGVKIRSTVPAFELYLNRENTPIAPGDHSSEYKDAGSGLATYVKITEIDDIKKITICVDKGEETDLVRYPQDLWTSESISQVFQQGTHTYDITATDYAGNERTQSYILNIDTQAPEYISGYVTAMEKQDNGTYTATVQFKASDDTSKVKSFSWYLDGNSSSTTVVDVDVNGTQTIQVPGLEAGTKHQMMWTVQDNAGNEPSDAGELAITVPTNENQLLSLDVSQLSGHDLYVWVYYADVENNNQRTWISPVSESDKVQVYQLENGVTYTIAWGRSDSDAPEFEFGLSDPVGVTLSGTDNNQITLVGETVANRSVKLNATLKEGDIWINSSAKWTILPADSTITDYNNIPAADILYSEITSNCDGKDVHVVRTSENASTIVINGNVSLGNIIAEETATLQFSQIGEKNKGTLTITGDIGPVDTAKELTIKLGYTNLRVEGSVIAKDINYSLTGENTKSIVNENVNVDSIRIPQTEDFMVGGTLSAKSGSISAGTYGGVVNTTDGKTPADLLASGFAYYDMDGNLVDGSSAINEKVTVKQKVVEAASLTKAGSSDAVIYSSLEEAITDAAKLENKGCTVKLLDHVETDSSIEIESGKFTIDLNGKTWTGAKNTLLEVAGADITIRGDGKLLVDEDSFAIVVSYGRLMLEGGTYSAILTYVDDTSFAELVKTPEGYGLFHPGIDGADGSWATADELSAVHGFIENISIKKIQSITAASLKNPVSYNSADFDVTLDSADANNATEIEGVVYAAGTAIADPFADTTSAITFTGSIAKDTTSGTVTCEGLSGHTSYDAYIRIKDGYAGQTVKKVTFTTTKESIEGKVTLDLGTGITAYAYNGTSQTPAVKLNGIEVAETDKLDISYSRAASDTTSKELMTTNAGTITVTVKAKEDSDYTGLVEKTYTIAKAKPAVSWSEAATNQSKEYTGSPVTDIAEPTIGLKNNETAHGTLSYEYQLSTANPATDVWEKGLPTDPLADTGTYRVRATVAATTNYEDVTSDTYMTLTITKKSVAVTITGDTTYTYDGASTYTHTATYKDVSGKDVTIPVQYKSDAYTASQTKPTAAGTYTLTPVMPATAFYEVDTASITGVTSFEIEKATPTIKMNPLGGYGATQTYTAGQIAAPVNTQFVETNADVSAPEYTFTWYTGQNSDGSAAELDAFKGNNRPIAVGKYTLLVQLAESANFNEASATFPVTVSYLSTTDSATLAATNEGEDDWYHGNVTVNAPLNYQISTQNGSAADTNWKNSLTVSEDMNGAYTYYLKNADGEITDAKTITVKKDTIAPEITKIEYDTTKSLFDWIFHNGQIEVTVTASDASSGVHHLSWAAGTQGSNNVTMTGGVGSFYIDKDYQGLPTVTVYDTAGNTKEGKINASTTNVTDTKGGVIAEDKAPVVELLYNGKTFVEKPENAEGYDAGTKVSVQVTDEGTAVSGVAKITYQVDEGTAVTLWETNSTDDTDLVTTVTKDRKNSDLQFSLQEGNHTYTITAADNAGNTTTKTVTVMIDRTKPVITAESITYTDITYQNAKVSLDFSDAIPTYDMTLLVYAYPAGTEDPEFGTTSHEAFCKKTITEGTTFAAVELGDFTPGTAYDVYFVVKDAYNNESDPVMKTLTTAKEPLDNNRTFNIQGNPAFGEVLSINDEFVEPTDGGTITYTWSRTKDGETEEIGNGKTYRVVKEDIGATITLRVSAKEGYSDAVKTTETVTKAAGPQAPTLAEQDDEADTFTFESIYK
ncbi:MAG: hypothetical protein EOM40_16655 [Clostridia bacterium]|nr:hypothetical protein [Clostridia bacterium]